MKKLDVGSVTNADICCEPGLLAVIYPMCRGAISVPIHQLLLERPVSTGHHLRIPKCTRTECLYLQKTPWEKFH